MDKVNDYGGINMGGNNLINKLNEVVEELIILEKKYRTVYNNALDIEDFEISQKTQSDAYIKIRKLKEWKGNLIDINKNIIDSNIIEIQYSLEEGSEVKAEVIDEINDEGLRKNNGISINNINESEKTSNYDRSTYISKEPIKMELLGEIYPVKCWNDVLIVVCEIMLLRSPYVVSRFNKEITLNIRQTVNFSYVESDIKGCKKRLSNGLWIKTDRSPDEAFIDSKKILTICRFKEKDLIVHFE